MRRFFRSAAFPILIVIVLAFFAQRLISPPSTEKTPTFNELPQRIETNPTSIDSVTFQQKTETVKVVEADGDEYSTGYPPELQASVVNQLDRADVETTIKGTGGSGFLSILTYILPFVLFFGFWLFLMNQMQGGGSRVMQFGKSKAKLLTKDTPKTTFSDVAGADAFVLPSRSEAFPNGAMEAMAAGLPVVAASVGGLLDLIDDGRTGVLVPPDDPAALAHALEALIDSPERAAVIGATAREEIARRYSFDRMVRAFEGLYLSRLGTPRRHSPRAA